jgi:hypothetical protein
MTWEGDGFELLTVAKASNYTWEDFDQLDPDDQARLIAHYRTTQRFLAVDRWANRPKPPTPKPSSGASHGTSARRHRTHRR